MFKKKNRNKNSRPMLSAYSIIMILIIALGIISHLLPKAQFTPIPVEEPPTNEVEATPTTNSEDITPETNSSESQTPSLENTSNPENVIDNQTETSSNNSSTLPVEGIDTEIDNGEITEKPDHFISDTAGENTYDSLEACQEATGNECAIVNGSGVVGAKLWQILIAPILGFENAIDVCIFIMVLGGFLAIVAKTKALDNGIKFLVKKLHGKE